MMFLSYCQSALLFLLLSIICRTSHGNVMTLHPSTEQCLDEEGVNTINGMGEIDELGDCISLDEALEMLEDNDTLLLSAGTYIIMAFSTEVVRDVSNITIRGNQEDPESVVINCSEGTGLFFFNVSDLSLSGVTIEGCGIKGIDRIDEIITITSEIIHLIYSPLPDFSAALLLIHCPNLQLSDTIIRNNRGFGLVGINLVGNAAIRRVQISHNHPSLCVLDLQRYNWEIGGSGGGAFLLYQDYTKDLHPQFRRSTARLDFSESSISDNFVCRLNLFHVLRDRLPRSTSLPQSLNFSMIGAGGLTLSLVQSIFYVDAVVDSCVFRNNSGTYNGAAMYVSQYELTNDSHVHVLNSTFEDNGKALLKEYGNKGVGPAGALNIWFYTPNPEGRGRRGVARNLLTQLPSSVVVSRSSFTGNVAKSGAGLCVNSFGPEVGVVQDFLEVDDCSFRQNQADFGGAIYLSELSYSGFERGLRVFLRNIDVRRNLKRDVSAGSSLQTESGIIDISFLNVTMMGDSYIGHNNDTAFSLYSSLLTVSGSALLEYNVGSTGGALDLASESYLILTGATNVTFFRNTALIAGGAVHVNFDSNRASKYDCFVFFTDPDFFCDLFGRCDTHIVYISFIENQAPLGGTLYGSTFTNCPWAGGTFNDMNAVETKEAILQRLTLFEPFLVINPSIRTHLDIVNSLARSIVSEEKELHITVMPGEAFDANLIALDQLKQPVPLTIFSQLTLIEGEQSNNSKALIGATNRYLLESGGNFTRVPVRVFGANSSTYNLTITSNEAHVEYNLTVTLRNCELGFSYDEETQSCECRIQDVLEGVSCEIDGTVTVPSGSWIGFVEGRGFVMHSCAITYCMDNLTRISLGDPDSQCRNNRAGILCGECREGFSRVLGSSVCRECSKYYNLSLIIVFAILGLLLVVLISLFEVTITDGYINGAIFATNIICLYLELSLKPPRAINSLVSRLTLSLINLNFGIEACFYKGMTDLHLAILNLVFPLYLGSILLVIMAVSKYKSFARLFNKIKIMHVFATLLLLSYTSLIRTSIDILSYVNIEASNDGSRFLMWRVDPNQPYLHNLHIFEFIVAIFLIIVLLPFPLLLLFPQVALRLPYVSRLKPLFDAFTAPFADRKHFWVGFRMLSRIFFFLLVLLEEKSRNVTICAFIILMTILDAYIKPFKTTGRNLVDLYAMVVLSLFSFLVVVIQSGPPIDETATIIVFALLILFSTSILVFLAYSIITAVPCMQRAKQRMGKSIREQMNSINKKAKESVAVSKANPTSSSVDEMTHTSFFLGMHREGFEVQYRESIFED